VPARPTGPVLLGSGELDERVNIRTTGPSEYSVRTVVLAPGEDTGWHAHPGTELTIVVSGQVELLAEEACDPVVFTAGSTLAVSDEQVHLVRNDSGRSAELVVTRLLTGDEPEQVDHVAAC
jgi:quercetin dioxygenase-like cupin family protein